MLTIISQIDSHWLLLSVDNKLAGCSLNHDIHVLTFSVFRIKYIICSNSLYCRVIHTDIIHTDII